MDLLTQKAGLVPQQFRSHFLEEVAARLLLNPSERPRRRKGQHRATKGIDY